MFIFCKYLGHKVNRRRVWNDGVDFRTACTRCTRPLLRDSGGWREFDNVRDSGWERSSQPKRDKG